MEVPILENYIVKEVRLIQMSFPSFCNCALYHSPFCNLSYLPPNEMIWKRKEVTQCHSELM
jgi:hypothetical protein